MMKEKMRKLMSMLKRIDYVMVACVCIMAIIASVTFCGVKMKDYDLKFVETMIKNQIQRLTSNQGQSKGNDPHLEPIYFGNGQVGGGDEAVHGDRETRDIYKDKAEPTSSPDFDSTALDRPCDSDNVIIDFNTDDETIGCNPYGANGPTEDLTEEELLKVRQLLEMSRCSD